MRSIAVPDAAQGSRSPTQTEETGSRIVLESLCLFVHCGLLLSLSLSLFVLVSTHTARTLAYALNKGHKPYRVCIVSTASTSSPTDVPYSFRTSRIWARPSQPTRIKLHHAWWKRPSCWRISLFLYLSRLSVLCETTCRCQQKVSIRSPSTLATSSDSLRSRPPVRHSRWVVHSQISS